MARLTKALLIAIYALLLWAAPAMADGGSCIFFNDSCVPYYDSELRESNGSGYPALVIDSTPAGTRHNDAWYACVSGDGTPTSGSTSHVYHEPVCAYMMMQWFPDGFGGRILRSQSVSAFIENYEQGAGGFNETMYFYLVPPTNMITITVGVDVVVGEGGPATNNIATAQWVRGSLSDFNHSGHGLFSSDSSSGASLEFSHWQIGSGKWLNRDIMNNWPIGQTGAASAYTVHPHWKLQLSQVGTSACETNPGSCRDAWARVTFTVLDWEGIWDEEPHIVNPECCDEPSVPGGPISWTPIQPLPVGTVPATTTLELGDVIAGSCYTIVPEMGPFEGEISIPYIFTWEFDVGWEYMELCIDTRTYSFVFLTHNIGLWVLMMFGVASVGIFYHLLKT